MKKGTTIQDEKSMVEKIGVIMLKSSIDELETILQGLKECDIIPNGLNQDKHVSHWIGKLETATENIKEVNLAIKTIYASVFHDL